MEHRWQERATGPGLWWVLEEGTLVRWLAEVEASKVVGGRPVVRLVLRVGPDGVVRTEGGMGRPAEAGGTWWARALVPQPPVFLVERLRGTGKVREGEAAEG